MSVDRGHSFGANILISFAFSAFLLVLAFTNSVIVARMVGTEGRGLYALAVALLAIAVPVSNLGLGFSSIWALGQGKPASEVATLNHLWSAVLLLFGGAVASAGLWWFGGLPEMEWPLVAIGMAATLPAAAYVENTRGFFLGRNQVIRYNGVQLATTGILLIANLLLLGWGPKAVLLTLAIAYWVPTLVMLLGHLPHLARAALPTRDLVDESVRYGTKATGSHLIEVLLFRLDYILVTPIVGMGAMGLFSVADQIVVVLAFGGLVAGRMMLAQSAGDPTGEVSRRKLGLAVRTLLVVVALAVVGIAATGWWLVPAIFGQEFEPAVLGLLIMLPNALSRGANGLISSHLVGRNVIRPVLVAGGVSVAVMLVLSPLAALTVGWLGVALVRLVVVSLQLGLNVRAYTLDSGESLRWIFDGEDFKALRRWVQVRLRRGSEEPPAQE